MTGQSFMTLSFKQTALRGIRPVQYFTFSCSQPGIVIVKDSVTGLVKELNHLQDKKQKPTAGDLSPIIHPPGLSLECQQ